MLNLCEANSTTLVVCEIDWILNLCNFIFLLVGVVCKIGCWKYGIIMNVLDVVQIIMVKTF